jgi:hypothetical protein
VRVRSLFPVVASTCALACAALVFGCSALTRPSEDIAPDPLSPALVAAKARAGAPKQGPARQPEAAGKVVGVAPAIAPAPPMPNQGPLPGALPKPQGG